MGQQSRYSWSYQDTLRVFLKWAEFQGQTLFLLPVNESAGILVSSHMTQTLFWQHREQNPPAQLLEFKSFSYSDVKTFLKNPSKYTLCVVSLGPVISCPGLSKNKVIWSENLPIRSRSNRIHSSRLKVNQNSPWDILATRCLIVVDINTFELCIEREMRIVSLRLVNRIHTCNSESPW